MNIGRYQFVWWGLSEPWRVRSIGAYPRDGEFSGGIYTHRLQFGPLEIRRFGTLAWRTR